MDLSVILNVSAKARTQGDTVNGRVELKVWYHSGAFERLESPDTVAGRVTLSAVYRDAQKNDRVRCAELHDAQAKRIAAFSHSPLDSVDTGR